MSGGLSSLLGPGLTGLASTYLGQVSDRQIAKDQAASQERIAYAQIASSQNFQRQAMVLGAAVLVAYLVFRKRGK